MTEADNAAATEGAASSNRAAAPYVPLARQLENLFSTLPENQRNRDWCIAELLPRLKGQFRPMPSAAKLASALRQLGFTQHRDYTRAGGGVRLWRRAVGQLSSQ